MIRNRDAQAAQRNKIKRIKFLTTLFFSSFLFYTFPHKTFAIQNQVEASQCTPIEWSALKNKDVSTVVKKTISALNKKDFSTLQKFFHPRLKISDVELKNLDYSWSHITGKPQEFSHYKQWILEEGQNCENGLFQLFPHYGYHKQYAFLLQVMGPRELGRMFLTIVPKKDKWYIGYLKFHQWTHLEKDYLSWIKEADYHFQEKNLYLAFLKYDIANKLLKGGPHLKFSFQKKVKDHLGKNFLKEKRIKELKVHLPNETILHTESIFSSNSISALIRFQIQKELSTVDLKKHCQSILNKFSRNSFLKEIKSLRCAYNSPYEDPNKEGKLGSIFLKNPENS